MLTHCLSILLKHIQVWKLCVVEVKHPKYTDNSSLAGVYYESFQDFLSSRHLECGSITFFFFFFFWGQDWYLRSGYYFSLLDTVQRILRNKGNGVGRNQRKKWKKKKAVTSRRLNTELFLLWLQRLGPELCHSCLQLSRGSVQFSHFFLKLSQKFLCFMLNLFCSSLSQCSSLWC